MTIDSAKKMQLSHEQRQALDLSKSTLVEASAGSGKTALLVSRYVELLTTHPEWDTEAVIAITFTKKAAKEMQERVAKQLPQHPTGTISTIHGFCANILKTYPIEAGIPPEFKILDDATSQYLWKKSLDHCFKKWAKTLSPPYLTYCKYHTRPTLREDLLSLHYKVDHVLKWTAPISADTPFRLKEISLSLISLSKEAEESYTQYKLKNEYLDYQDLLYYTHHLVTTVPEIRQELQNATKALLIDEFQDTDPLQWELLRTIAQIPTSDQNWQCPTNLFIVGDPKQAIYGFRGLNAEIFTDLKTQFEHHSPLTQVVILSDNYRTQSYLIEELNPKMITLFAQDPTITYQPMNAKRKGTLSPACTIDFYTNKKTDPDYEIKKTIEWIHTTKTELSLHWKEFGILVRTKKNGLHFQAALQASGLPAALYQAPAPPDNLNWALLNLAECLVDPTQPLIQTGAYHNALFQIPFGTPLNTEKWQTIIKQYPLSETLSKIIQQDAVYKIDITQTSFFKKLTQLEQTPFITDKNIIEQLHHWIPYQRALPDPLTTPDAIQILTIHAAKGLEFSATIIPYCGQEWNFSSTHRLLITASGLGISYTIDNKNINPHREKLKEQEKTKTIAEEKKLFYVACTRAKEALFLIGNKVETERKYPKSYTDLLFH